MKTTIELVQKFEPDAGPDYTCRDYIVRRGDDWCRVTTYGGSRYLTGLGGSIWPAQIPELFEHYGPDKGMLTGRSFYKFRDDVEVPL